jgi:23S rRNA pseudouridine2605 synthase
MGAPVTPGVDRVTLDDKPLDLPRDERWAAYHKPRGVLVSRRSQGGKPTIFDLLGESAHGLMPVGRLDYESEGLLLLTSDGALAEALLHPRSGLVRGYRVWVTPDPDPGQMARLRAGAVVEGVRVRPLAVQHDRNERAIEGGGVLRMDLAEGKKREVRVLAKSVRLSVRRLVRVRFGPILLGAQRPGTLRRLTPREIDALHGAAAPDSAHG